MRDGTRSGSWVRSQKFGSCGRRRRERKERKQGRDEMAATVAAINPCFGGGGAAVRGAWCVVVRAGGER